jgi:hypothetical protein
MTGFRDVNWVKRESISGYYKHSSSLGDGDQMNDSGVSRRRRSMELFSYKNRIFQRILQLIIKILNDKNECFCLVAQKIF